MGQSDRYVYILQLFMIFFSMYNVQRRNIFKVLKTYYLFWSYSGCRADANEAAVVLLPSNITVFTLDFSGSGLSDGDYVSLGWHEVVF